ncbi:hypothetical protein [Caballeronia fortuita]|nr:hypothetical protein [Caballeronia fortuita]
MLLDFTLTMIFASAGFAERTRYDSYGSRIAWSERILTYLIPCVISMLLALRFRRRQHSAREPGRLGNDAARENPAEIQTFRRTRAKLRI